jgi:hypothetical protein
MEERKEEVPRKMKIGQIITENLTNLRIRIAKQYETRYMCMRAEKRSIFNK